ncbi:hypothetical protein VK792_15025 [Mesobacterium sp. TK19101]|uniref:Uncharacterized protein n=1 Tax=Mesobacterium hydrothermale TaxID=3111907 RepID=A0ABU6HKG0_9RHOB|nr:hypothetical protein [Mesobacterium sp. TK19101]MEC3862602.1 hypothetical protein [Mesobacterium sp. TK19101]
MTTTPKRDLLSGLLLLILTGLAIMGQWGLGGDWVTYAKAGVTLALIVELCTWVKRTRLAFVGLALILTGMLLFTDADWGKTVVAGLSTAAFIAAFFTAITVLKSVAQGDASIQKAGAVLAAQKPGRRYLALTVGGQAFSLLLNYGSLQLLGTLAVASAKTEQDPEIRAIRTRRMLLAIDRALLSTLPWSPLSFAMAISTSLIVGATWSNVALPALVSGVILAATGWALDSILKPKLSGGRRAAPQTAPGGWEAMLPLGILLAVLLVGVVVLQTISGVRVIGVVMVLVPMMAVGWLLIQNAGHRPVQATAEKLGRYIFGEIQDFSGEMMLLMMAGYIGTVGGHVLGPALLSLGLDLGSVPPVLLLVSMVWVVPLLGQLGMNPILAVSLIAPLLPSAAAMGVPPAAVVLALTAGWTLCGATSPVAATVLLVGHFAEVSAWRVGLRWNGLYAIVCAVLLSIWVAAYALWV